MPSWLSRLHRARSGSIAPTFAVVLLPILFSVGAASDYGRAIVRKSSMQASLDNGVLAAAAIRDVTDATAKRAIESMVAANFSGSEAWQLQEHHVTEERVTAKVRFTMDTIFMSLAGIPSVDIAVEAVAQRPQGRVEVALVLDNTGSMASSNKIGSLRTAALDLVSILEDSAQNRANLSITLVPFVTAVNIKVDGKTKDSWIDKTGVNATNGANMSGAKALRNHWAVFDVLGTLDPAWAWKGCVEARPIPYALTDQVPTASIPDSLFVPYLWPDEPDTPTTTDKGVTVTSFDNSYLADQSSGTVQERQANVVKYRSGQTKIAQKPTPAAKPYNTHGPNKSCGQPVLPLTNDMTTVRAAISAMRPWDDSGTNVSEGIAWGWRMLSPEEPFTEGARWTDTTTRKYMVVLTDGENTIFGGDTGYAAKSFNKSQYTSWGYIANNRFDGATTVAGARDKVDGYTETVCGSVKAKGVTVYAITFLLTDTKTKELYKRCADSGKYYDSPSTAQLSAIFQAIARDISPVRLGK